MTAIASPISKQHPEKAYILGTQLSLYDNQQMLAYIRDAVQHQQKVTILSGNVYSFNLAFEQEWLRAFFNQANIVRLDGAGVRLGGQLLGYRPPTRMTWADFAWELAEFAEQHGFTLYFLGARPGVAQRAAERLTARFPNLQIVGTDHGYFNKEPGSTESTQVIQKLNQAKPQIVVIGFGMPVQERWLSHYRNQINAEVVMTGGAVFDYISGELQRAPRWMTDHGMEWLGRLLIEPRRLWKRYILGNPLFFWRILMYKAEQLQKFQRFGPQS
ncbi:MAG: WecB/TagA/CpsF family glycosyltransferase [Caldilineaceae bacterium]